MDSLARGGKDLAKEIKTRTQLAGVTGVIQYRSSSRVPAKPVAIIDAQRPRQMLRQVTPSAIPVP